MRLFVAINLPAAERRRIHRETASLRERDLPVRWVEPGHFHVTLRFLGELRREDVDAVERAVAQAAEGNGPFEARVGGFGAFPTIRRPRVLWIGIQPSPSLRCLKQDLEWALADAGYDRDDRAFHPHVTLGRTRGPGGAGKFRGLDEMVSDIECAGAFQVKKVDLMNSRPGSGGPRYKVISSSRLDSGG